MKHRYVVAPGIYQVGGPGLSDYDDCCIYLVDGGSEMALIDTGAGSSVRAVIKNIEQCVGSLTAVKTIIVTHGHIDHVGGLKQLALFLNAHIVAHDLERPAIEEGQPELTAAAYYGVHYEPVPVDTVLTGSSTDIMIGSTRLTCLHTPGHTRGSISVYTDAPGQRVLFGQDIHGPFNPQWGSDLSQWRASMQKLLALDADLLCEGHFGICSPRNEVAAFIMRHLKAHQHG